MSNLLFDSLNRPDLYDHRRESELHSEAASRAACGVTSIAVPVREPTNFEAWYHSLSVGESIRYCDNDPEIRHCTDSRGNVTYPWRTK
jgi:hypothetical protein